MPIALQPMSITLSAASRAGSLAARFASTLLRRRLARRSRRALEALPDELLTDVGLSRGDITFVAEALAFGHGDPTREVDHFVNRAAPVALRLAA